MKFTSSAVTIDLDGPDEYSNNDKIRGTITVQVKEKIDTSGITVRLLGEARSQTVQTSYNIDFQSHKLVDKKIRVFPPPGIAAVSESDKFTLGAGTHSYRFEMVVPDGQFDAKCREGRQLFHSKGFVRGEKSIQVVTLPPSFWFVNSIGEEAKITYVLVAEIEKLAFYKVNPLSSLPIQLTPQNDMLTYSLNHICKTARKKHTLLGPTTSVCFDIGLGTSKQRKFWKRLEPSNVVPFELKLTHKGAYLQETIYGLSYRHLQTKTSLANLFDLHLITSQADIMTLANGSPPETKLVTSSILFEIDQSVTFTGESTKCANNRIPVWTRPLNRVIDWSDFVQIINEDNKRVSYQYNLPNDWLAGTIPDLKQSFLTCNIKNNYSLIVTLDIGTTICQSESCESKSICKPKPIFETKSISLVSKMIVFQSPSPLPNQEMVPIYDGAKLPEYHQ